METLVKQMARLLTAVPTRKQMTGVVPFDVMVSQTSPVGFIVEGACPLLYTIILNDSCAAAILICCGKHGTTDYLVRTRTLRKPK